MINIIWSCLIGGLLIGFIFLAFFGKKCLVLTDKTHKDPVIPIRFHKIIELEYYLVPTIIILFFVIVHFMFHK